jgi:integrase
MQIADTLEQAAQNRLTKAQAMRLLNEYLQSNDTSQPAVSYSEFRSRWLERKKNDVRKVTYRHYEDVTGQLGRWLGERATGPMHGVTTHDIATWRSEVAARSTAVTANYKLKVARVMFSDAWRESVIWDNPAAKVRVLKARPSTRRAFTASELHALLKVAAGEWRGMVLVGLYTGQRLRDVATLTWAQIDFEEGIIRFTTSKTGRQQAIPMVPAVASFLSEQPSSDDPSAAVFSNAAAVVRRTGATSGLSAAFNRILASIGLVGQQIRKLDGPSGVGRSGRRQTNELSFHSLRHTATTMLKMSGATEAVVRDIIGHDSAVVSRHYTHVGDQDKRDALAKLAAVNLS